MTAQAESNPLFCLRLLEHPADFRSQLPAQGDGPPAHHGHGQPPLGEGRGGFQADEPGADDHYPGAREGGGDNGVSVVGAPEGKDVGPLGPRYFQPPGHPPGGQEQAVIGEGAAVGKSQSL